MYNTIKYIVGISYSVSNFINEVQTNVFYKIPSVNESKPSQNIISLT